MTFSRPRLFSALALVAVFLTAGSAWYARGAGAPTAGTPAPKKQLYTCPMHPQVIQDHPGRCPICGMNLVPVKPSATKSSAPSAGFPGGGCCGGATPNQGN